MTIKNCLDKITLLTEKYDLVIEQNNELHACNQQLLRQHAAHETELVIVKKTMALNGFKPLESKNLSEAITINQPITPAKKQHCKSLDGNTPFRKLSNQISAELKAQRT
jgi:hypothetical protein